MEYQARGLIAELAIARLYPYLNKLFKMNYL